MAYMHQAQYYETDQMGIIHHSNYIRWMEEARIAYMDGMDFPYRKVEEAGIVSPVLAVECQYKSMTHFGDRILIDVKLDSFNGVKYTISYVMREEKTGEVRAVGMTKHCYLDKSGRPVTVKKALPALYDKMKEALDADQEVQKKDQEDRS